MVLVERRLGVERIDVRGPTVHEQVHDLFGLGRKMRLLGSQRTDAASSRFGRRSQHAVAGQQACESEHPEAHAAAAKQLAPRHATGRIESVVRTALSHGDNFR